jgi:hypothetical protein
MAQEIISAKGSVFLQIWNAKGELLETIKQDNLIVNIGKQAMAILLGSANPDYAVARIGFGTSGNPVAGADTSLTGAYVKGLDGVSFNGTSVIFEYALELNEMNGVTIREFGLYSDNNQLFSRITRNAISKTSDIRLSGTWTITF